MAKKVTGFLKLQVPAGAANPSPPIGRVTTAQLREIATQKMQDMNTTDLEAAVRMLAGSARSMGLTVAE